MCIIATIYTRDYVEGDMEMCVCEKRTNLC